MKVSDSVPSDPSSRPPPAGRATGSTSGGRFAVPAVAGVWLLAHLPLLSPALEDIDSINFALGLHHYDPAQHQPHPPGYPVFIAVGRAALAMIRLAAPGLSPVRADALALALWSALGGAIAIVAAAALFREMTMARTSGGAVGTWGAVMLAITPLFWLTGLRPMSDMFGLGVALAAQVLLLRGARASGRGLVAGACLAGLAAGIRTQTVPLTVPLLVYALVRQRHRRGWLIRPVVAGAAGVLAWAVPLLVVTGGIDGYLRALGSQAGEDFAWVDMLWVNPTPRAVAVALYDSFLLPFAHPVAGAVIVGLAGIGVVRMLLIDRRALLLLSLAFGPYAVFHLLFQEAANLRYATPLVPGVAFAVAFLACSFEPQAPRARRQLLVALPVVALLLAPNLMVPAGFAAADVPLAASYRYGREVHPAFRAITDMERDGAADPPGAVFSHYSLRRALQVAALPLPVVEPRRTYEWLGLEDYWLRGGREPVWFLADPTRTDLALIDPQVRRADRRREYRWSVAGRPELMGTRPLAVDWYRLEPPGWFAGEGWELTPETAGVARVTNTGLARRPITAYVRRRSGPMTAIVAGRDLSESPTRAAVLDLAVDGRVIDQWRVEPSAGRIDFFHVVALPDGIPPGDGDYATLTITARGGQPGAPTPQVAVEQFDIQPQATVMFGFGEGWHEAEYNNRTGLAWRWTSDRAALRIFAGQPVAIHVRGESPLKYVESPPTVRVRAGPRELAVFHPDDDFQWTVVVPGDALADSGGVVTIDTDRVYEPGRAEGTADARRLGLRIFETRVEPAGR